MYEGNKNLEKKIKCHFPSLSEKVIWRNNVFQNEEDRTTIGMLYLIF